MPREICPLGFDCPDPQACFRMGIEIDLSQVDGAKAAGLETDRSVDGTIPQVMVCEGPIRYDTITPKTESAASLDEGTVEELRLIILDGMEYAAWSIRYQRNNPESDSQEE